MKTTPKKNGGFTLVELIVVIAILAILAAVAIPAYSGYIEKAEKAGDLQILGAINTAFAAACTNEGFSQLDVKGAMIPVAEDGTMGNGTITLSATPSAPKFIASLVFVDNTGLTNEELIAFNNAFALFFSGNETAAFKTIKSGLFYSPLEGGFVTMEDYEGDVTVSYKGSAITVSAEAAKKLTDSTFGDIGATKLLTNVDYVTDLCTGVLLDGTGAAAESLQDLVNSDEYLATLYARMGFDNEDEYYTYLDENDLSEMEVLTNNLLLSAAQNTNSLSTNLLQNLSEGKVTVEISGEESLAEAGAVYALYTAYAAKNGIDTSTVGGVGSLNSVLGSAEFQKYAASDVAAADLEAYKAAMSVVNGAANDTNATKAILTNGFTDEELMALMGAVMGN